MLQNLQSYWIGTAPSVKLSGASFPALTEIAISVTKTVGLCWLFLASQEIHVIFEESSQELLFMQGNTSLFILVCHNGRNVLWLYHGLESALLLRGCGCENDLYTLHSTRIGNIMRIYSLTFIEAMWFNKSSWMVMVRHWHTRSIETIDGCDKTDIKTKFLLF